MAKKLAIILGIIFVLAGLLGFVPNPIVGMSALFEANVAHNLVHLISGLILLAVGMWAADKAALWLKILGVVYLIVAVLGFIMPSPLLGVIDINGSDNLLHVVLGIVLLAAGYMSKDSGMGGNMNMPMPNSGAQPMS